MPRIEWDERKDRENRRRHGVAFSEAATVLRDPLAITIEDPEHSGVEHREVTIGWSGDARLLVVVHTAGDTVLRIISARMATSHERRTYEERA